MKSPFPGMDPYLEGSLWTTLYFGLAAEMVRQLAPRLRPRYVALPVERLIMESPDDIRVTSIYPDASVLQSKPDPLPVGALSTLVAPYSMPTVMPALVPHVSIEIRDTAGRELVAAIEILSPTKKRGKGRQIANHQRYLSPPLSELAIKTYIETAGESPVDPYDRLTVREREVFNLAVEGLSNVQLGKRLFISPRTAEHHRENVFRKLSLRNQTDLIRFAVRRGLITLDE